MNNSKKVFLHAGCQPQIGMFFIFINQWERWTFKNLGSSDRQLANTYNSTSLQKGHVPPRGETTYYSKNKATALFLIVNLPILHCKQFMVEYLQI